MKQSTRQKRWGSSSLTTITGREGSVLLVPWCGVTGEPKRQVSMVNISEPYVIHYPRIVAVADESGNRVELIEFFDCIGGAMWSKCHYAQSPLVEDVRCVGSTMRYTLKTGTTDL